MNFCKQTMTDKFLSYLVTEQKITPEQIRNIRNLMQSPRYFILQAVWLDSVRPDQVREAMSESSHSSESAALKDIFTSEIRGKVSEEIQRNTRLVEQIILDMGIMDREKIERRLDDFRKSQDPAPATTDKATEANLNILLSSPDDAVREKVTSGLTTHGHNTSVFTSAFDLEKAAAAQPADLLICDVTTEGLDGIEIIGHILKSHSNMKALVFSDDADDYQLPAQLQLNKRLSLHCRAEFLEVFEKLVQAESAKKATNILSAAAAGKPGKATPTTEEMKARLADWIQTAVDIQYTPQGATLFIDREKVPHVDDRYNMPQYERTLYEAFFQAVQSKIQNLRIEQVDAQAVEVCVWYPWSVPVRIAPQQVQTLDAEAEFKLSRDGNQVLARYSPPNGKGRNMRKSDFVRKIKEVASEFFISEDTIARILASTEPLQKIPVAERRDAEIEIEFSSDETEADMILHRPYGGKTVSADDVLAMLAEMGIKEGIIRHAIEETCFAGAWDKHVTIARGKPVSHGENGKVVFLVEDKKAASENGASNNVDLRVVSRLQKVYAGEAIISAVPPTEGSPGMSVRGETIPPTPGKPVSFSFSKSKEKGSDIILGENVQLIDDDKGVVSAIDGVLHHDGRHVSVSHMYEIKGDVDFSVGNVDAHGDLFIRGSVMSKFEVKASGDIYIQGAVEDAIVESGRSIYVEQGIFGQKKAIVYAAGDVEAACFEQANIFCLGTAKAKRSIAHSTVIAARAVEAVDSEGFIVGGNIRSGLYVSAAKLGSQAGTMTSIEVGSAIDFHEEMRKAREALLKKISGGQKSLIGGQQKTQQDASDDDDDASGQPAPQADIADKYKYDGYAIKSYDRYYIDWMDNWIEKNKGRHIAAAPQHSKTIHMKVIGSNHTFPGVSLKINNLHFNVKSEMAGKRVFKISGDKIIEST